MAETLPLKLVDIGSGNGEIREFAATDTLAWTKLSSTPTTLAGYGITDFTGLLPTVTELNYVDGVTSSIQTQLGAKLTSVTGAAPIVSSGGLTPAISISAATTGAAGSMSAADKTKLDGIAAGAQVNVATDLTLGTITATTIPINSSTGTDVTLPAATTSLAGLQSAADKTKLDGVPNFAGLLPTVTELNYVDGVTSDIQTQLNNKQATLVSGTSIKTLNSVSLLGSGNIVIDDSGKLPLTGGALTGNVTTTGTFVSSNTTATTSATTGSIRTSGGVGVSGDIYAGGNITAYSDIRLKTNIEVIPDALEKVCAIRGVTYDRIDTGERQTGVIAQEVQAVLPEAVRGDDILGVSYGNMVGILIEAIKELNTKVESLTMELKILKECK